jgi:threonylcarbamoyladenosine tRNA methylthiotransferase MtaB
MPNCCIGVDVITGFPGETNEDFLQTYNFLNSLDVSYLHVFTYSERDNTDALQIQPVVPISVRKQRNKMLRILSQKKLYHFYQQHLGNFYTVLFESENKEGMLHGFTENYIKVKTPFDTTLCNQLVDVELVSVDDDMSVTAKATEFAVPLPF